MTIEVASPLTPMIARRRVGFLSLCASIILPGLGQLIAHRPKRAATWFLVTVFLGSLDFLCLFISQLIPALLVLAPLTLIVQLWMLIDAFLCGHRFESLRLGHPLVKYPLGLLLLAIQISARPGLHMAFFIRAHCVEAFVLPTTSNSMRPTIVPADHFLVHKLIQPKRWDVVTFYSPLRPHEKYVERLIGLPGEKIEIIKGIIHVNGEPQASPAGVGPYVCTTPTGLPIRSLITQPTGCEGDPITLATDEYYVLGDNSLISFDSRYWESVLPGHQRGTLSRASIIGVASWIYWPPTHWRKLY
jgi:signal peptidase I